MLRAISGVKLLTKQDLPSLHANNSRLSSYKKFHVSRRSVSDQENNFPKQPAVHTSECSTSFFDNRRDSRHRASSPINVSSPRFISMEHSRQIFSEATWNRMNLITPLLMSFQARGIGNFLRNPGAGKIGRAHV